jgi:hypothetical protein
MVKFYGVIILRFLMIYFLTPDPSPKERGVRI